MSDNAPANALVSFVNQVFDDLITGIAAQAIINSQVAQNPILGWPIIYGIFSYVVNQLATVLDTNIKKNVDGVIIRFQDESKLADYNAALAAYNQGVENAETQDQIDAERAILDASISSVINRNK